jgi:hypothetical protein
VSNHVNMRFVVLLFGAVVGAAIAGVVDAKLSKKSSTSAQVVEKSEEEEVVESAPVRASKQEQK